MSVYKQTIKLRMIRLDASTVCQLKCPSCPTASGETGKKLGSDFLKFDDFKRVVDKNPWVSHIELSNWGEIFLNQELIKMLRYAYKHNVLLSARNGANLNNVRKDVLEALVKYKFQMITCSIDGASPETYSIYRVNGNFDQVIENIRKINRFKAYYKSPYPKLKWQFIAFGHNEHEIGKARRMAADLNMTFRLKLSWEDLYNENFSPVKDPDLIRRETGLGVADRDEFREKYGREYALRNCCLGLWNMPQVNYDGKVLGCCVNYWDDYGNAFIDGLVECLNGAKINAARKALMGENVGEVIPCLRCKVYARMKKTNSWITQEETPGRYHKSRKRIMLENKVLGVKLTDRLVKLKIKGASGKINNFGSASPKCAGTDKSKKLSTGVYPLSIPLETDSKRGRKSYQIFRGPTTSLFELESHASALIKDRSPHFPHEHREEELLLLLSGEVDLIFPGKDDTGQNRRRRLKAGEFVYYPSCFSHTLQTKSETPANYLMFKWYGQQRRGKLPLPFGQFEFSDPPEDPGRSKGFRSMRLFAGPTIYLKKLHCHMSKLKPGSGYDEHVDSYDVVIIVLEGEVETLDKRVGPHNIIYYAAGDPHGMYNPGDAVAKYVVFEFHPHESMALFRKSLRRMTSFSAKVKDPQRWKKKLKQLFSAD